MINNKRNFKKVVNLDYLLSLSKGNTKFVKEMLDTFLEENPKEIDSLEKAIQSKNFEAIRQASHLLQSSLPFVGLDKVIEGEVYEIERLAIDKTDIQKIESLFLKVKENCANARLELKTINDYSSTK
jgi:HPt (histidine-containing phosphotransfer) domain-containing protein